MGLSSPLEKWKKGDDMLKMITSENSKNDDTDETVYANNIYYNNNKDVEALTPLIEEKSGQKSLSLYSTIQFGTYSHGRDNSTKPIEWLVIEVDDKNVTLLSKKTIECKKYHSRWGEADWDTSTLNYWLNSDFVSEAFDESQSAAIISEKNYVRLLSRDEVQKYTNKPEIICSSPTEYARKKGAKYNKEGNGPYWTMDIQDDEHAYMVSGGGNLRAANANVDFVGVRPVIVVDFHRYPLTEQESE